MTPEIRRHSGAGGAASSSSADTWGAPEGRPPARRLRRGWGALAAGLLGSLLLPASGAAQWPVGQGDYWAKLSFFHHRTTEEFRSNGEKRPYLADDAVSRSNAVFFDALVGLTDRLDVWAQVPYFDLSFDDAANDRDSRGVGDVRLSARYNLLQLRGGTIPVSARFTVKAPVADLTVDAEVIPLGEGQWDYEAWLESGVSLWPLPLYSVVWLGYRWRTLNETTTRDPGNEFTFLAELGGTSLVGGLGAKVVVDGIFGEPGVIQGIQLGPGDRREILYVAPTLLYGFTPETMLEVGVRIPLKGRNFPAGAPIQIGVFHQGSLFH